MDELDRNKQRAELFHKRELAAFAVIGAVEGFLPWIEECLPQSGPARLLRSAINEFHEAEKRLHLFLRNECSKAAGKS